MTTEKDVSSSDTLERSNLSSLQSDNSSTKKTSELNMSKIQNCFCQQHSLANIKLVPCPILSSNFDQNQYSHQCLCQRFKLNGGDLQKQSDDNKKEWERFNYKWPRQSYSHKKDKSYEMKPKSKRYYDSEKPFSCCEVLEGIPRKKSSAGRNVIENPLKRDWSAKDESEIAEKIEIYYFDHGNSAYYHTTDLPPIVFTDRFAEKSSSAATRFWAEIFGFVHIAVNLLTNFVLQLLRFLMYSFVRPLTVGVVQLLADYFFKPLLSITFNGIIQPVLILFYNIATSLRDCCEPLATAFGFYLKEVAVVLRSCRLVEINHNYRSGNSNT